jgi:hypothetical protein
MLRGLHFGRLSCAALTSGLLLACPRPAAERPNPAGTVVEYSGCQTVDRGPVCRLGSRPLLLIVDRPPAALQIAADGQEIPAQLTSIALAGSPAATEVQVMVPERATSLTAKDGASGSVLWTLAVASDPRPAWLEEGKTALSQGRFSEVEALAAGRLAAPAATATDRAYALELQRILAWRQGHTDQARHLAASLSTQWAQLGALRRAADEASVAGYLAMLDNEFIEARGLLSRQQDLVASMRAGSAVAADAEGILAYDRALLARLTGDFRGAFAAQERTADLAGRHDLFLHGWRTAQTQAALLAELGRGEEAAALLLRLREENVPGARPRDRALLLANLGWVLNLALEAGQTQVDPLPFLLEARRLEGEEKGNPERVLNILLNMTWAHLLLGRPEEARSVAAGVEPLLPHAMPEQNFQWLELQGRIALAGGSTQRAQRLYSNLEQLAEDLGSQELRWQAAFGAAQALAAAGHAEQALARLEEAESWLSAQRLAIPLQEGRESFLAQRQRASSFKMELLVRRDEYAAALAWARRQRHRVLDGLIQGDRRAQLDLARQARWDRAMTDYALARASHDQAVGEVWKLPADQRTASEARNNERQAQIDRVLDELFGILEAPSATRQTSLMPPADGDLLLAYHPLPKGWVAFAAHGNSVEIAEFRLPQPLPPLAELTRLLLEPFHAQVASARRLRVLPMGVLQNVDFHALPWNGGVLVDAKPVVYGIDLPPVPPLKPPAVGRQRALLVGDPGSDLPVARAEVEKLAVLLSARGWQVEQWQGPAASAGRVQQAQSEIDFFHFAGHGIFAGRAGWGSALELANGSRLTVGDLLTLRKSPRWAVLASCETGKADAKLPIESLGIAQALIVAGSRQVLAATARVDDRFAGRLIQDFYAAWLAEPERDFAAALRQAQLQNRDSAGEWAKFRVFER